MTRIEPGDCLTVIPRLVAEGVLVDAIVCDPPFGLEFMGKEWDAPWRDGFTASPAGTYPDSLGQTRRNPACLNCGKPARGAKRCACSAPSFDTGWKAAHDKSIGYQKWTEAWARAAMAILKPGGYLLAFGGTRTYHRMTCAIEDAGFEVRDAIMWHYGTGFPKSLNVSKAIDKATGAERTQVIGVRPGHEDFIGRTDAHSAGARREGWDRPWKDDPASVLAHHQLTAPATPEAAAWEGWGTALKPATEIICVARKPLSERTVAANVLKHGTGALNIDECRIEGEGNKTFDRMAGDRSREQYRTGTTGTAVLSDMGRWPANLCHDGSPEVMALFPDSAGQQAAVHPDSGTGQKTNGILGKFATNSDHEPRGDGGSAARFFFAAPPDKLCQLCGCDVLNAAASSSIDATINPETSPSARNDVPGCSLLESEGKTPRSSGAVSDAISASPQCHPTTGDIVPPSVCIWPIERIAQNVRSAAILCNSCVTAIAQGLVEIRSNGSEGLSLLALSISDSTKTILIRSLARYVANRENTDTILTTESLRELFGSVFYAIVESTNSESRAPLGKSEPKRLFYSSKADGHDRWGSKHPTVKPVKLIEWLITLVTRRGGLVLDCFAGSGTAGVAALATGRDAILIEREPNYIEDIRARVGFYEGGGRHSVAAKARNAVEKPGALL